MTSQWRTVIVSLFASTLLAAVYGLSVWRAGIPLDLENAGKLFGHLTDAVVWITLGVAFKALGQHLGKGAGAKGALASLLTDAKSEEPKP